MAEAVGRGRVARSRPGRAPSGREPEEGCRGGSSQLGVVLNLQLLRSLMTIVENAAAVRHAGASDARSVSVMAGTVGGGLEVPGSTGQKAGNRMRRVGGGVTAESGRTREMVRQAFQDTLARVADEVAVLPLECWNESVFRYALCRSIAEVRPEAHQFVESDRIDLVLRTDHGAAFIEIKFYLRRRRIAAYTGEARGFKGGPSAQNLREFQSCVDRLHARPSVPGLSKLIVLVYADPAPGKPTPGGRFANYLDDYHHRDPTVPLSVLETYGPVRAGHDDLRATLFELASDDHAHQG